MCFTTSIHNRGAIYTVVNQLIGFLLGLVFILIFDKNIHFIFIGTIISSSVVLLLILKELRPKLPRYQINFDKEVLKDYYRFGVPMTFAVFASVILNLSDRLVIQYFLSSTEVALYDMPARITEKSILLLLTLFDMVDRPYILGQVNVKSKAELQKNIQSFVRLFLLLMIPVITSYFILSKELIYLISDKKYLDSSQVIPIIALSYFFIGLGGRYQLGSLIAKKAKIFFIISMTCGLLNVIGNIILIPKFGYKVAAYTTLFSAIIYFFWHLYYSKKFYLDNIFLKLLFKFILIGIILIIVSKFLFIKTIALMDLSLFIRSLMTIAIIFSLFALELIIFKEHKSIFQFLKKYIKR